MGRIVNKKERKPLIVICSEGGKRSSEYYYFRSFATRDLRVQFSTGNSTDPEGMLQDLLKYITNEDIKSEDNCKVYLVIDKSEPHTHLFNSVFFHLRKGSIIPYSQLCKKNAQK